MKKYLCHFFVIQKIFPELIYIDKSRCKMGLGLKKADFAPGVKLESYPVVPNPGSKNFGLNLRFKIWVKNLL